MILASARLKASMQFPPLRQMYQRGGTCKGCENLPSQKKLDELEAKSTFLHEKAKKVSNELKEEKEAHR